MTPRKRVLAALNHREPDRAQVDPSGYRSCGVATMAYPKLPKHLGLESKPARVCDVIQQLASVDGDVLDCLGVEQVHNVLANVPAENIVARFDAVSAPR